MSKLRSVVPQVLRGFAMGSADIVPGVSGGTVALVLGIYERLIAEVRAGAGALRLLLTGAFAEALAALRRVSWVWLVSLLVGILAAIAVLSSLIEELLHTQPVRTAAVFLGLVGGSVVVAWRTIGAITTRYVATAAVVAIGLFLLLGLRDETEATGAEVVTRSWVIFTLVGAIAICAMILPGVSGSFILVMLGMYTEVLGAVNDRDVVVLLAFALGCAIGLGVFSTLLNWLLEHHHGLVLSAMVGLMVGSLRVLWPWPGGTGTTRLEWPADDVVVPVILVVVAFAVVMVLERVSYATRD